MQFSQFLTSIHAVFAASFVWRNGQFVPADDSVDPDPFIIKLAVRFGWILLVGLAILVFRLFPNRHRLVGKIFLIAGFVLAAPMLGVIWTGHSKDMGDWNPNTRNAILISCGIGVLLALTGGAFIYVRMQAERMGAIEAKASQDNSTGSPPALGQ